MIITFFYFSCSNEAAQRNIIHLLYGWIEAAKKEIISIMAWLSCGVFFFIERS